MSLTASQQQAYQKFRKLKVGALFMKQGTGKTRVAVELANSTDAELVVFVVPHALKKNIQDEIIKWQLEKDYIIETYQGIAMSDNRYLQLLDKLKDKRVMIVADESTFIKNGKSKTHQRMVTLRDLSEYRLILNGTPITKDEWDLYHQMEFLSPKIFNMNPYEFREIFFKRIEYKKRGHRPQTFYKRSDVNISYFKKLIAPYTFYVDLDFEHKEHEKEQLVFSSDQCHHDYQKAKHELLKSIEFGDNEIIPQLTRMQSLIFSDDERLKGIAKRINGQCIVFCNYLHEIKTLHRLVGGYLICGETKNREDIIEQFKNNNQPLFIMIGIGAFGHNLQFCHRVMFSSLTFDYSKIEQAMYRVKRLGQEHDIEYTFFESEFGIYNMIRENLTKKQTLHQLIIERLEKGDLNECL